ncbi:glycosyltransferase [Niabella drilacis]|uniref:UDP:flavonoid glycosyltransferase YjiC, YdhE family n=1 Tax=Niabella drilacis (strain DSM 25811 / CCM 8410 / CCUG 62505 / LMG 26954 / E90) TaxID=1285928 RepID=A0A1G6ILA4_NIADE|nr:nucleotide disphospho-sugar-binding domain-containing protein [Niabella drilacis]SDC07299.1 UDP:flavonoid glycosyltransferase YjiC, YdhE family [Niabella drilacis]
MYTKTANTASTVAPLGGPFKKRILFANIPADGHFNPLTGLAVQLKNAGHDVRWYTGPSYAPRIRQLDIPFYLFNKAKEVTVHNIDEVFPERKQIRNHVKKVIFDICTYFIERGTEFYEDIKDINKRFDFDVLICDSAFTGMSFVKEKLCKHAVAIGILPLCESSKQLPPPIMGLTPAKTRAGKVFHSFLRLLTNKVLLKKPHALIDAQYRRVGMSTNGRNLFDVQIDKATLFLQSGTPGFEYKRTHMSRHIHFIGPLLPYNNSAVQPLGFENKFHQYEKILLVTQGTFEGDVNKLIVPAIEAFKNSNYLVIVTTAGWQTRMLRGRYKAFDNIVIEDFIPFSQVMPFADVFISNGGYGGVMQSICNKLPLVVAGIHEGKNEICARVGYFGIGINLRTEHPRPEKIKNAVNKILGTPVYQENIETLSAEFARYNPLSLCEKFIDQLPVPYRQ